MLCADVSVCSLIKHLDMAGPDKRRGILGSRDVGHRSVKIAKCLWFHETFISSSENKNKEALNERKNKEALDVLDAEKIQVGQFNSTISKPDYGPRCSASRAAVRATLWLSDVMLNDLL